MNDHAKAGGVRRRTLLIGAAGALPLVALSTTGAKAAKLTQAAVRYQTSPKDGKHCGICNFYIPPSSCKNVEGPIVPDGYCPLWVQKA